MNLNVHFHTLSTDGIFVEDEAGKIQFQRLPAPTQAEIMQLTKLRAEFPEYKALNAQSEQVTLTRLDLAFQHFFRRVKSGAEKAGFPRFKSIDRYPL